MSDASTEMIIDHPDESSSTTGVMTRAQSRAQNSPRFTELVAKARTKAKTRTFHKFSDLPPEIRNKIWNLLEPGTRIIQLNANVDGESWRDFDATGGSLNMDESFRHRTTWNIDPRGSLFIRPVGLDICKESRVETLRHYKSLSDMSIWPRGATFNPRTDVFFISNLPIYYMDPQDRQHITSIVMSHENAKLSLKQLIKNPNERDHPLAALTHLRILRLIPGMEKSLEFSWYKFQRVKLTDTAYRLEQRNEEVENMRQEIERLYARARSLRSGMPAIQIEMRRVVTIRKGASLK